MLDVPYVRTSDRVPQALPDALASNKCILFLGAGASRGAVDPQSERLPSWEPFVTDLLGEIEKEAPQDVSKDYGFLMPVPTRPVIA
jgi:hypothetical protein